MPAKSLRKPAYTLHKPSGQARVRLNGKDHYLGEYGSPESRERYDDLVREWTLGRDPNAYSLTVDELCLRFMQHAAEHYRKDGRPTSEIHCLRLALRPLVKLHGTSRAREFGPKALKAVRDAMIEAGYVRTSINIHVSRIKRCFRWAVENELLPIDVYQRLCTVAGLRKERTRAREAAPVPAVPEETVEATLPYLPLPVAAMVRLQLLTGARPGEVCSMRPRDITLGKDGVWTFRPGSHKTIHHGRERRIFLGPQAQKVLRPFLKRDPDAYCFSPAEAEAARSTKRREARQSPMTPSQSARTPKGRQFRTRYVKDAYARAIVRGCIRAFDMPQELRNIRRTLEAVPEARRPAEKRRLLRAAAEWRAIYCWSPNQLRHTRATAIRERFGIEAAQVVLGHSDAKTTEIYAERDFAMAARIMREIG